MNMLDTGQPVRACHSPIRTRVAAGLLTAILVLAGCGDDDSDDVSDSEPAEVIEDYQIAYNDSDIDAVMVFFSEDSVLSGHPLEAESMAGLEAIRSHHRGDMALAAETDAYKTSNVEVSGDTVTWDHVWTNTAGTDYCAEGNSALITNGQILTWTFAPNPHPCA